MWRSHSNVRCAGLKSTRKMRTELFTMMLESSQCVATPFATVVSQTLTQIGKMRSKKLKKTKGVRHHGQRAQFARRKSKWTTRRGCKPHAVSRITNCATSSTSSTIVQGHKVLRTSRQSGAWRTLDGLVPKLVALTAPPKPAFRKVVSLPHSCLPQFCNSSMKAGLPSNHLTSTRLCPSSHQACSFLERKRHSSALVLSGRIPAGRVISHPHPPPRRCACGGPRRCHCRPAPAAPWLQPFPRAKPAPRTGIPKPPRRASST
mmetsp:Transcript_32989/g.68980  ORF Transcript_32989/g.68980 Transcript_32989/m.68980 type:complete len:261 (-) Transcript_32989:223-1005(-)